MSFFNKLFRIHYHINFTKSILRFLNYFKFRRKIQCLVLFDTMNNEFTIFTLYYVFIYSNKPFVVHNFFHIKTNETYE